MKQSIKGLKEADDVYSQQIQALNEIKEGLVYKEGARKGEIRDNFHQIINTLDGPNRSIMAERLNSLRPGLVEEIQAVHHMKKLADAYYRTPVVWKNLLSKGMGLVLGGAGGFSYGPLGIVAGALAGFFAEQGLTKLSQSRVQHLIDGLGKETQLKLERIGDKLEQGKELTTKEDHLLQDIAEQLQDTKKTIGGKEPTTMVNSQSIDNFSEKSSNSYKKLDGAVIEHKQGDNTTDRDFKKRQFSNKYELALTDNLKPKTQLVDLIKVGELEKGSLAQVPAEAFHDGKARPLELTTDRYAKIFQKHGPFSHENLIATANDWDYMIKDLNGEEGHINLIKELPDGSSLLIGAKRDNGALVVTHFEPTKSVNKVLDDAKKNGGEVIERGLGKFREGAETKYQIQNKKNYQEYRKEVERYRSELEEGIEVEDDYGQLFSSKKSIQDEISELESELNSYNEDDRMRSNYAEGADTYEERREWIEDNITQYEDLYSKFIKKTKALEDDIIYSMPAELRELLMNNKDTGGSAWRKAIEAYIDGDSETFDMMMKNIEGAEYRHNHTSYDQIRDEAKGLSEEAYKSYRKEFNTDIETDYRHYIDNHSYQKVSGDKNYGIANPLEKNITAQRATQLENIRNGKSVQELADHYDIDIKTVEKITTPEGLQAYGKYGDGVITLAETIKEGTAPHELFHATFDLVDHGRKGEILKNIMKEKGLDALNAEEYLADSFADYFRTGKFDARSFGKGLIEQIKQFFDTVKQWITGANNNKAQVKKLFDEILDGEIDREMLGEILGNEKSTTLLNQLQEAGGRPGVVPSSKRIVISADNANVFKQKIENLKKGIKNGDWSAEDFLEGLRNNLEFNEKSGYLLSNSRTLRIADHSANARNYAHNKQLNNNTSVVIKLADAKFRANKFVDLIEFVYNPENLTTEKMQGIIKGVQDWIDTGEYTDRGYDLTHKSIRASLENGEVKYQRVYHGSPYEFDKFDSAHMGEGAGSQAHGWGHYVAVDRETGIKYARNIENSMYKGKKYNQLAKEGASTEEFVAKNVIDRYALANSYEEALENSRYVDGEMEDIRRNLKKSDFSLNDKNLYEIEIPDPVKANTPTGKNYLEEQGKIKSRAVDAIVKQLKKGLSQEKILQLDELIDSWESGYDHSIEGGRMYGIIANTLGSDHKASIFLQSLGYDGIHYHGGRDGEAYVIFDDDKLEIKKHWDNGVEKYKLVEDDLNKGSLEQIKRQFPNLKAIGQGEFGTIYEGVKGVDAEKLLISQKGGEVRGAYTYKGDPVDLIWGEYDGKKGYGLKKILEKHPNVLGKIQGLIDTLPEVSRTENRIKLGDDHSFIVLSKQWKNKKKSRVLTAFIKD